MSLTFSLRDITVTAIDEFVFAIPLEVLFPGADRHRLDDAGWPGTRDASGGVNLSVRSWLLRTPTRNILVDTCVGADKTRPAWPSWHQRDGEDWRRALAATGLAPEDIDIVFCTHLHADHVGWNTVLNNGRWVPTFANARTLVGRDEYSHFAAAFEADRHGAFGDSIAPVMEAGLMDLVDDGYRLADGLDLVLTPGHSPGHMCLNAPGAVFCGDVIHTPLQLADPDLSAAFDSDKAAARASRRTLLERVSDTGALLVPAHFPAPGRCGLARKGGGFRPVFPDIAG